jgi:hypothetical protein
VGPGVFVQQPAPVVVVVRQPAATAIDELRHGLQIAARLLKHKRKDLVQYVHVVVADRLPLAEARGGTFEPYCEPTYSRNGHASYGDLHRIANSDPREDFDARRQLSDRGVRHNVIKLMVGHHRMPAKNHALIVSRAKVPR